MIVRNTLIASALATALAIAAPAQAATDYVVTLNIGPPAVVYEPVPQPRVGYVWAPGYWDYNKKKHVWHKGHWERERHGHQYVAGGWHEYNGRWGLTRGYWTTN